MCFQVAKGRGEKKTIPHCTEQPVFACFARTAVAHQPGRETLSYHKPHGARHLLNYDQGTAPPQSIGLNLLNNEKLPDLMYGRLCIFFCVLDPACRAGVHLGHRKWDAKTMWQYLQYLETIHEEMENSITADQRKQSPCSTGTRDRCFRLYQASRPTDATG